MSLYEEKLEEYNILIEKETDVLALLSSTVSFLHGSLEDISWVGFYFIRGEQLELGPCQGKGISSQMQICHWVLQNNRAIIVPDVEKFDGIVGKEKESSSEIALPMFLQGKLYGILSIHSLELDNFCILEQVFLGEILENLAKKILL